MHPFVFKVKVTRQHLGQRLDKYQFSAILRITTALILSTTLQGTFPSCRKVQEKKKKKKNSLHCCAVGTCPINGRRKISRTIVKRRTSQAQIEKRLELLSYFYINFRKNQNIEVHKFDRTGTLDHIKLTYILAPNELLLLRQDCARQLTYTAMMFCSKLRK